MLYEDTKKPVPGLSEIISFNKPHKHKQEPFAKDMANLPRDDSKISDNSKLSPDMAPADEVKAMLEHSGNGMY